MLILVTGGVGYIGSSRKPKCTKAEDIIAAWKRHSTHLNGYGE